jgi:PAS domain S-box-containing protein/putative nucleotidyltransferase with HDIG domain
MGAPREAIFRCQQTLDGDGKILQVDEAWRQAFGFSQEEILGRPFAVLLTEPSAKEFSTSWGEWRRTGKPQELMVQIVRKDGQVQGFSLQAETIRSQEGGISCLLERVSEPLTAHELTASTASLADQLIETAIAPVVGLDRDGQVRVFNPAAQRITGYSLEEVRAKGWFEVVATDEKRTEAHNLFERWRQERKLAPFCEYPIATRSGQVRYLSWKNSEVHDPEGQPILICAGMDTSEQSASEQPSTEDTQALAALIQACPLPTIAINREGLVRIWNPSAERTFGWSRQEVLGQPLPTVPPEKQAEHQQLREHIFRGDQVGGTEIRRVRKDGVPIDLTIFASTLYDAEGRVSGAMAVFMEMTDQARVQKELQLRLAELEAVNRISTTLRSASTVGEMMPILLDEILAVLAVQAGAVYLRDPLDGGMREVAVRGWLAKAASKYSEGEQSLAGHMLSGGSAHLIEDFSADPWTPDEMKATLLHNWAGAAVPIRSAQEVVGVILIAAERPRSVKKAELSLLGTIAEIAGNAIHRMRLHADMEANLDRLTALHSIELAISASTDLRVTLEILLDKVTGLLQVGAADVLLLKPHSQTLEYAAGRGFRGSAISKARWRLGEGLAGRAALERRVLTVLDLPSDAKIFSSEVRQPRGRFLEGEGFISQVVAPLIAKGDVKGVLEIFHRAPLNPSPEWLEFLQTLAGQAAIAIENASLLEDLQRSNLELMLAYDATLEGWSRALDLRDRETEGHTQRVAELALRLARTMGVPAERLEHVRRGALLHDIGKMGIPDGILLKPGPLTEVEWQVMRMHPVYARDLLYPITYLRQAIDIPYCHHEKWDGTGYPRGLKGEEIPLPARIFAVVDVWDALLSDRPYRTAWPKEKALGYLREQSGRHFDPNVVDVFLSFEL